jgi:hypothetical protein
MAKFCPSKVNGDGLDDWGSIHLKNIDFYFRSHVQNYSGATPEICTMGCLPGVKVAGTLS